MEDIICLMEVGLMKDLMGLNRSWIDDVRGECQGRNVLEPFTKPLQGQIMVSHM